MKHPPAYSALNDNVRDRHERVFTAAHIRRTQVAAAGKRFADDMAGWAWWYLLAVRTGHEEEVAKDLDEQGIDAWVPKMRERKKVLRRGKGSKRAIIETKVLIFSGFVMVRFVPSAQAWHGLMGFDHVLGLVAPKSESWDRMSVDQRRLGYMTLRYIERIRLMESAEFIDLCTGQGWFKVGEKVRIEGGPFGGLTGIVNKKPAPEQMIWVDVMIFGQGTKTLFELDQINKKD